MSVRIFKGLYQLAIYTMGICILLAAVAATIIRLFLPDIGMYRSEIAAWVGNYMNLPVAIRTLEADWQGWTPSLYLQDIDLLNRAGTTPIIKFESARVSIDPVATLLQRQIVPERLIISGFELRLTRMADGSIDIAGIEAGAKQPAGTNDELAEWLLAQRLIELQQVKIKWQDETLTQLPVTLSDVSLTLRSDRRRVQIEGSSQLPSMYGDSFSFAADITGNPLTSDWSAELFVQGRNISPDFWYRQYWPEDLNLNGGYATVSMWSSWQHARPTAIKGKLEYNDFEFVSGDGGILKVDSLSAWLNSHKNNNDSWTINLDIEKLATQNGNWQPAKIDILAEPATASYTLNVNYLKLDDLYPVLSTLSFLPPAAGQFMTDHPFHGSLSDSRIRYRKNAPEGEQLAFDIKLDLMDTPPAGKLPSFRELSARIQGTVNNGRIRFTDDDTEIEYISADKHETIPVRINGELAWSAGDDGYLLSTNGLHLQNSDIDARLSGTVGLDGKCCTINMMAGIEPAAVDALIRHIPHTFRLRDWLQRSVRNGTVNQATALYRGHTMDFPFDQHTGVFEMLLDVSGATLEYSPSWPAIERIDGQIAFSGRTMKIDVRNGTIFDAAIKTATAVIPDVIPRQKMLNIDGHLDGVTADLKQYVQQSPLGNNRMLANLAKSVSDNGAAGLDLQLAIPLRRPGRETGVTGNLRLADTTLATDMQDIQFTDITGDIQFTRSTVNAGHLSASYDGNPVQVTVRSTDTDGINPVTVSISGNADNLFINSQLNRHFPGLTSLNDTLKDRLIGTTDWQASLIYARNTAGTEMERTLKITSDMYGMNVNLPEPLTKHAYLKTALEISKNLDNDTLPLTIRYGNVLTSEVFLDSGKGMRKMDVNFGNRTYRYPEHEGILFYGNVERLELDEWFTLFRRLETPGTEHQVIDLQADMLLGNLHTLGQTFNNTSLHAGRETDKWNIRLDGENVKGMLTIPIGQDEEKPITAELEYLKLENSTGTGEKDNRIVPTKLPSITAHVDSFEYAGLDLGEMTFIAGAAEYGLYIDTLSFSRPAFTIEASGKWNGTDTIDNSSDFTIQAHAAELGKMLETFGYDVNAVRKGETSLAIDANWEGTPMDFSLNKLNGTLGIKIGQGQLLDIQPSAGRLFGLLSLQTLPRRLTLDFSDLFGDGMAFDIIQGNFIIRNGDAYTNDLIMKGPSVDILISGRTGLSTQDYDQIAIVTPQISDSLAVASGFLGPMGLGLGTVLYFAGNLFEPLQDSINKIMKFQYSISGSWNEPVIEKHRQSPATRG